MYLSKPKGSFFLLLRLLQGLLGIELANIKRLYFIERISIWIFFDMVFSWYGTNGIIIFILLLGMNFVSFQFFLWGCWLEIDFIFYLVPYIALICIDWWASYYFTHNWRDRIKMVEAITLTIGLNFFVSFLTYYQTHSKNKQVILKRS